MSIRPSDLQSSLFQTVQSASLSQRAEEAPHQAALVAQAAFVSEMAQREETVAASGDVEGNRVGADGERERQTPHKRKPHPNNPFADTVDDAAGLDEPAHLIDFTA